jgi:phosphoglucomutase
MREDILKKAKAWTAPQFDEETRTEIQKLIDSKNEKELTDRFYKELEFGTGGMRGLMAAGQNRMNTYTVGKATQGLANYLLQHHADTRERGVAIAYDSRNNSQRFAREAAGVLAANGIPVFIYPELRPTPLLSYTVRTLNNRAGVVITASHNPKEYNGYKVYSSDGSQVTSPEDVRIVEEVNKVDILSGVKRMGYDEGLSSGMIREIGPEIESSYLDRVKALAAELEKGISAEMRGSGRKVKIVYSPLHGTGVKLVPCALDAVGGAVVLCEPEQSKPDGNFPTTPSPNPEETAALARAIDYAGREKADMVIATDPDCDRMGLAVPSAGGGFVTLTGNQIGSMLEYLVASSYEKTGLVRGRPVVVSTIVTTELAGAIAGSFGADIYYTLTGFKYIAGLMRDFEQNDNNSFIFAFEESYGYLAGTFVRDKDAVIASVLALLLVKYSASAHGSVLGFLEHLYRKYGMYEEFGNSFTLKGAEGADKIDAIMRQLREHPPEKIDGSPMELVKDFQAQTLTRVKTGSVEEMSQLPVSNVLQYYTRDGSKISVRPSGTEPKIKFYFGFHTPFSGSMEETRARLKEKYRSVSEDVFKLCGLS